MRTYSHALLTLHASRRHAPRTYTSAILGATLPDVPALVGAAWLAANRLGRFSRKDFQTEVCGRSLSSRPDAALHCTLTVSGAFALHAVLNTKRGATRTPLYAFLLGWAGHVFADALRHGSDARPLLWPVSAYHFESPVSYRERDRHAFPFAVAGRAADPFAAHKAIIGIADPHHR